MRDDWPLCFFILVIELFGSFSSLSYAERYDRNTERVHIVRGSIDEQYLSGRVKQLRDEQMRESREDIGSYAA
jgi:hypothetical protein